MIQTSGNVNEIGAALAKAQAEIKDATKSGVNTHFKAKYASLSDVVDACRDALAKNGIAVVQSPGNDATAVLVTTMLIHSSGQWISGEVSAIPQRLDPQSIGSAITYLRRYSLAAMAGVAPDDDDGEAAQGRGVEIPVTSMPPKSEPKVTTPSFDFINPFHLDQESGAWSEKKTPDLDARGFCKALEYALNEPRLQPEQKKEIWTRNAPIIQLLKMKAAKAKPVLEEMHRTHFPPVG